MGGSSAVLVDSFRLTFVEPLHLRLCVGSIDLLSLSLSLSLSSTGTCIWITGTTRTRTILQYTL